MDKTVSGIVTVFGYMWNNLKLKNYNWAFGFLQKKTKAKQFALFRRN